MPELKAAVAKGYVITKVYEVWHFTNQRSDLFKGFINTSLKFKQEALGCPSEVGEDPEKQRAYVEADWMGVRLKRILGCDPWPR